MKITLQTKTPIWTGGVDGKVDRLHETGLIGSLRWWYEALVRGLGGYACDPTKHTCPDKDGNYCDVCQTFGATGWRRRFRLDVEESVLTDAPIASTIKLHNRKYKRRDGTEKTPTWYFRHPSKSNFPNTPKAGVFTIHIRNLSDDFQPEIIAGLLQFIADWSALGARAQMGFGVVEIANTRMDTQYLYNRLLHSTGEREYPHLPSLKNCFFAHIAPKDVKAFSEKDTFILKYDLRRLFADDRSLRHFIMGTAVKGQRMAAKINVSRPYDGEIRLWGWVPEKSKLYTGHWDRTKIVGSIHDHLDQHYMLREWREMNSPHDTITPYTNDAAIFLSSLLGLTGE